MIKFKGLDLPKYVKITSPPRTSLLPPVSQDIIQIPGKPGSYDFGNTFENRSIEVDFFIVSTGRLDLKNKIREFAKWLHSEESQPLIVLEEPDKQYFAKVTGDTELKRFAHTGSGTITFVCHDPFAYSTSEKVIDFNPTDTSPIVIENNGQVDAFPTIELEFTEDTTEFSIVSDDQYMYFGQPDLVDVTPTPQKVMVLDDDCSSTAHWTSGIGVENGAMVGGIESDGSVIRQAGGDYGTGEKWHGWAGVQALSRQLQDFSIELYITFRTTYPNQLGRIQLYLLGPSNQVIGLIAIEDPTVNSRMGKLTARAGAVSGGVTFLSSEVGREFYVNFYGRLRISRVGNRWDFGIGKIDSKGTYFGRYSRTYFDVNNSFQTLLAGIQLHFAQFNTYQAVSTMSVNHIRVFEENVLIPGEVPFIFEAGDRLTVDSQKGIVLKNGEPFFYGIGDLGSTFIKLNPGENGLSVTPPITQNGKITFREGWL